jgi:hypothetical protein
LIEKAVTVTNLYSDQKSPGGFYAESVRNMTYFIVITAFTYSHVSKFISYDRQAAIPNNYPQKPVDKKVIHAESVRNLR